MSLINEVLVDLEKRKGGGSAPMSEMLNDTLPSRSSRGGNDRRSLIALLILLAAVAAAGAWWFDQSASVPSIAPRALAPPNATSQPALASADSDQAPAPILPEREATTPAGVKESEPALPSPALLQRISVKSLNHADRILFSLSRALDYQVIQDRDKHIVDIILPDTDTVEPLSTKALKGRLIEHATASYETGHISIALTLTQSVDIEASLSESSDNAGYQLAIDLKPVPVASSQPRPTVPKAATEKPTATKADKPDSATTQAPTKPAASAKAPETKALKTISKTQQADNLYQQALTQLSLQKTDGARTLLLTALELAPDHPRVRYTLAALLINQGQMGAAEILLSEGLNAQPGYAPFAMLYARIKAERNETAEAIAAMEGALINAQRDAAYQAQLAALYQRQENHAKAVTHYTQALQLEPITAAWWMGMGISLEHERRGIDAITAYQRARALGGLSADALAYVESRLKALERSR